MVKLTMKEQKKLEVVQRVMDRQMRVTEAGTVLGRSERQIYRMLAAVRRGGIQGVIHKNWGNQHAVKIKTSLKRKIVAWVGGKYRDINDTHLQEILKREEKIDLSRQSLRLILRKAGIKPKRKRRSPKYRSRRERKESFGMMIQIDASFHDWLENRGPRMVLVGGIDDATGFVWAQFEESESCWGYLRLFRQMALSHGVPLSLYSDRHTIFHSPKEPTIVEQLENRRPLTQFGRAMQEMTIEMIPAYSAPAKGRIEKLWETFQDRLIVEMRLKGIRTMDEANAFLPVFLIDWNRRFTVPARKKEKVFRQRPSLQQLDRILCLKETRVVQKDHTVRFEGLVLQIPPSAKWVSIARQTVEVLQLKEGRVEIVYKDKVVAQFSAVAIDRLVQKYQENSQLKQAA